MGVGGAAREQSFRFWVENEYWYPVINKGCTGIRYTAVAAQLPTLCDKERRLTAGRQQVGCSAILQWKLLGCRNITEGGGLVMLRLLPAMIVQLQCKRRHQRRESALELCPLLHSSARACTEDVQNTSAAFAMQAHYLRHGACLPELHHRPPMRIIQN